AAAEQFQATEVGLDRCFPPAVAQPAPHRCLANEVRRLALPAGESRIDLLRRLVQAVIVPDLQPLPEAIEEGAEFFEIFVERRLKGLADAAALNFVPGNQVAAAGPLAIELDSVLVD